MWSSSSWSSLRRKRTSGRSCRKNQWLIYRLIFCPCFWLCISFACGCALHVHADDVKRCYLTLNCLLVCDDDTNIFNFCTVKIMLGKERTADELQLARCGGLYLDYLSLYTITTYSISFHMVLPWKKMVFLFSHIRVCVPVHTANIIHIAHAVCLYIYY